MHHLPIVTVAVSAGYSRGRAVRARACEQRCAFVRLACARRNSLGIGAPFAALAFVLLLGACAASERGAPGQLDPGIDGVAVLAPGSVPQWWAPAPQVLPGPTLVVAAAGRELASARGALADAARVARERLAAQVAAASQGARARVLARLRGGGVRALGAPEADTARRGPAAGAASNDRRDSGRRSTPRVRMLQVAIVAQALVANEERSGYVGYAQVRVPLRAVALGLTRALGVEARLGGWRAPARDAVLAALLDALRPKLPGEPTLSGSDA